MNFKFMLWAFDRAYDRQVICEGNDSSIWNLLYVLYTFSSLPPKFILIIDLGIILSFDLKIMVVRVDVEEDTKNIVSSGTRHQKQLSEKYLFF